VLEIHAQSLVSENEHAFRVMCHSGELSSPVLGDKLCWFVKTSEEAQAVYSYLYDKYTKPPSYYKKYKTRIPGEIGSKKFQKVTYFIFNTDKFAMNFNNVSK
jgi:hypothetical protein